MSVLTSRTHPGTPYQSTTMHFIARLQLSSQSITTVIPTKSTSTHIHNNNNHLSLLLLVPLFA